MSNDKQPITFTLNGVVFRGSYLDPEESLDAFAILAPCVSSVLGDLDPKILSEIKFKAGEKPDTKKMAALGADVISKGLMQFKDLPKLRPYFLRAYTAEVQHSQGTQKLPLAACEKEVFKGKAFLFVAFLVAAIKEEYGDFLPGRDSTIFKDLGEIFGFRLTLKDAGHSGG